MSHRVWPPSPVYLAHDHMDRPEDFARDIDGGVSGKILHMVVDAWIDAPTREQYEEAYYGYAGFLNRGLAAITQVLKHAAAAENVCASSALSKTSKPPPKTTS